MKMKELRQKIKAKKAEVDQLQEQFDARRKSGGNPSLVFYEIQSLSYRISDKSVELYELEKQYTGLQIKYAYLIGIPLIMGLALLIELYKAVG
ncbi:MULTISPECIES: hypothetical protein [Acinetobacter]|uniref:hypothetical protein n=1 Tax=Acinetobacter TaxID=469 RepID=UPI00047B11B7|nr:hypothetical protein [Acinetobacter sp. UNC436CL71CviS28]